MSNPATFNKIQMKGRPFDCASRYKEQKKNLTIYVFIIQNARRILENKGMRTVVPRYIHLFIRLIYIDIHVPMMILQ